MGLRKTVPPYSRFSTMAWARRHTWRLLPERSPRITNTHPPVSYTHQMCIRDRAQTVNWSYDGAGRLTCATNGTTAATYAYDPEGNLVSITQSSGGCPAPPQGAQVSEVTASSAGNILTFSDGAPSGLLQAPPASTSKPNPNSTPVSASGFATPSTAKQPQS